MNCFVTQLIKPKSELQLSTGTAKKNSSKLSKQNLSVTAKIDVSVAILTVEMFCQACFNVEKANRLQQSAQSKEPKKKIWVLFEYRKRNSMKIFCKKINK